MLWLQSSVSCRELMPSVFMQHRALHSDARIEIRVTSVRLMIACTLGLEGWGWTGNVINWPEKELILLKHIDLSCTALKSSQLLA